MKRRDAMAALAAGLLLGPASVRPLHAAGPRRIGLLLPQESCESFGADIGPEMRKVLSGLGHPQIVVTARCFGRDFAKAEAMAAELVRGGMEVIFTAGTPTTRILQAATTTIPIVAHLNDPVAGGFTKNVARPEGNVTGFSQRRPETAAKEIELVRQVVPRATGLVLVGESRYEGMRELLQHYRAVAKAAGLAAESRLVGKSEVDGLLAGMKGTRTQAALFLFAGMEKAELAALALRYRVPTLLQYRGYVEHGGLMSLQMYYTDRARREGAIADKLFRGAKTTSIPWELPDRSHLALNLRTAEALGLTIPADVRIRADQVVS